MHTFSSSNSPPFGSRESPEKLTISAISLDRAIECCVSCRLTVDGVVVPEVSIDPNATRRRMLDPGVAIFPDTSLTVCCSLRAGIRRPFSSQAEPSSSREFALGEILGQLSLDANNNEKRDGDLRDLRAILQVNLGKTNTLQLPFERYIVDDGPAVQIRKIRVETADVRTLYYLGVEIRADGETLTECLVSRPFPQKVSMPATLCLPSDKDLRLCVVRRPWPFKAPFWPFKSVIKSASFTMAELRAPLLAIDKESRQKSIWHELPSLPELSLSLRWENMKAIMEDTKQIVSGRTYILNRLGRSREIFENLVRVSGAVIELSTPAKVIAGALREIYDRFTGLETCDEKIINLIETMLTFTGYIEQLQGIDDVDALCANLKTLAPQMKGVANFVAKYGQQGMRVFTAREEINEYDKLEHQFKRWTKQFVTCLGVETYSAVKSLPEVMQKQMELFMRRSVDMLKRIHPQMVDRPRPFTPCLSGTRQQLLDDIKEWMLDVRAPNILWIKGYPGSGKTCVASSAVKLCEESSGVHLGASFFFERDKESFTAPSTMIRNLSTQLSARDRHNKFLTALAAELEPHGGDIDYATTSVGNQFRYLIEQPLRTLATAREYAETPLVVLIDALDECGGLDQLTRDDDLAQLLQALERWPTLPASLRLIITSRDEEGIANVFTPDVAKIIELRRSESVADVECFLRSRLHKIGAHWNVPDWPSEPDLQALTRKAGGLFVWASTVVDFLDEPCPDTKLERLLSGEIPLSGRISELYKLIISMAFCKRKAGSDEWVPPSSGDFRRELEYLVGAITTAQHPLHQDSPLLGLLGVHGRTIKTFCQQLRSVLVVQDGVDELTFKHQSFIDFLISEVCPSVFRVTLQKARSRISLAILACLNQGLRFNSTEISSSRRSNRSPERSLTRIPAEVMFACRFWADTLPSKLDETQEQHVLIELWSFFERKFLFWLEILSLSDARAVDCAIQQLHSADRLLRDRRYGQRHPFADRVQAFIADAIKFLHQFRHCVGKSAPHIYLSAMSFEALEPSSQVRELYAPRLEPYYVKINIPTIESLRMGRKEELAANVFVAHDSEIAHPFEGHIDDITSVVFIQNGLVASASYDSSIRFWDPDSGGAPTLKPLLDQHINGVSYLSSSEDGTLLASGGKDGRVAIWDVAAEAKSILEFDVRTPVTAIALSPDSTVVVVGLKDGSIRFRSLLGNPVRLAFPRDEGSLPAGSVRIAGLAFLDSERVVSASRDGTVRLHHLSGRNDRLFQTNPRIYALAVGKAPFRIVVASGHSVTICELSEDFTPSRLEELPEEPKNIEALALHGNRLAVATGNKIFLVDLVTKVKTMMELEGHSDVVTSIAFSSSGERLVSGSLDRSVRVWDVRIGDVASEHGGFPDGSRLSASEGWILGPHRELLVWIPVERRRRLCWGRTVAVMDGKPSMSLALSMDLVGSRWDRCFKQ